MARQTLYLVQAFRSGKGTRLQADPPISCRTPEVALRRAENLAAARAGVVAFSTSADAEIGDYDEEPTIFFRAGRLPESFAEG